MFHKINLKQVEVIEFVVTSLSGLSFSLYMKQIFVKLMILELFVLTWKFHIDAFQIRVPWMS